MRVEFFSEVRATKPLEVGGETYDPNGEMTWSLLDSVESTIEDVVAAFLCGLADDIDPPPNAHGQRSSSSSPSGRMRVCVWDTSSKEDEKLLTSIISSKPRTVGATLRGTAATLKPKKTTRGD